MNNLEQAALNYLEALEAGGLDHTIDSAEDKLCQAAIIWAQNRTIKKVARVLLKERLLRFIFKQ